MLFAVLSTFTVPNQSSITSKTDLKFMEINSPPPHSLCFTKILADSSSYFCRFQSIPPNQTCGYLLYFCRIQQLDTSNFTISPPLPQIPCILAKKCCRLLFLLQPYPINSPPTPISSKTIGDYWEPSSHAGSLENKGHLIY